MSGNGIESGVLLVDKPAGMTSHDVVRKAMKMLNAKRAGHTGTLDMGVTGLLVVAVGEARKTMPVLMGLDKGYDGLMQVHREASLVDVRKAAKAFTGRITQVPPKRSRVARKARERHIHSFVITKKEGNLFSFRVECQAGTYIRKLVHDLGEKLGCGAHMVQLRRTSVGPFIVRDSVKLDEARPSDIMPLEPALEKVGLKKVLIRLAAVEKVKSGRPVSEEDIERKDRAKEGETVGIYFSDRILALGTASKGGARTDRVFNR